MWFWWGLASALMASSTFVINRYTLKTLPASFTTFILMFFGLPVSGIILVFKGLPEYSAAFFLIILMAGAISGIGKLLTMYALESNPTYAVVPLTSLNPVWTYLGGLIFLKEGLSIKEMLGLGFIIIGVYLLNKDPRKSFLYPFTQLIRKKTLFFYILGGVLMSLAVVFVKRSLSELEPADPVFAHFVFFLTASFILFLFSARSESPGKFLGYLKGRLTLLILVGFLYAGSVLLLYVGFLDGKASLSLGVKQLQIFFAVIIAWVFLKERPDKSSFFACILASLGAVLVR